MMSGSRPSQTPPGWLIDWLQESRQRDHSHSLVLDATTSHNLQQLSSAVADYLNEFDYQCRCAWRSFDCDFLQQLANDRASRNLILCHLQSNQESEGEASRPDLERIVRRLATLGGAVIVGPCVVHSTHDLQKTFRVYLCRNLRPHHASCHLWINPGQFSPATLVSVIANSFLDWCCPATI